MDFETLKAIFKDNLITGLSLGLMVWFFAWGMNRVYLVVKSMFSFR